MQSDLGALGATHLVIGLSAILRCAPDAFVYSRSLKILSGGGTLEIVPIPLALSGTSCVGWGLGYPIGAGEVVSTDGPTVFYLAATGATMTAALAIGYTVGVTTL